MDTINTDLSLVPMTAEDYEQVVALWSAGAKPECKAEFSGDGGLHREFCLGHSKAIRG